MILGVFCNVEGQEPLGFSHGSFRRGVPATVRRDGYGRWACGQRKRVAHMPTATTTIAEIPISLDLANEPPRPPTACPEKHVKPPTYLPEEAKLREVHHRYCLDDQVHDVVLLSHSIMSAGSRAFWRRSGSAKVLGHCSIRVGALARVNPCRCQQCQRLLGASTARMPFRAPDSGTGSILARLASCRNRTSPTDFSDEAQEKPHTSSGQSRPSDSGHEKSALLSLLTWRKVICVLSDSVIVVDTLEAFPGNRQVLQRILGLVREAAGGTVTQESHLIAAEEVGDERLASGALQELEDVVSLPRPAW